MVTQNSRLLSRKSRACTRHNKQLLYVLVAYGICTSECNTGVKRVSCANEKKTKDDNIVVVGRILAWRLLTVTSRTKSLRQKIGIIFHPIPIFWLTFFRTDAFHDVKRYFIMNVWKDETICWDNRASRKRFTVSHKIQRFILRRRSLCNFSYRVAKRVMKSKTWSPYCRLFLQFEQR